MAANNEAELMAELSSAMNAFAIDLYQQLMKESPGENIFFSPTSITFALAMTYLGARKRTAKQMGKVLHFNEVDEAYLHPLLKKLHSDLNPDSDDYVLHTANRLYGQKGFNFLKPFIESVEHYYGSTLEVVDFVKRTEKARKMINKWVESATNEKITKLIPRGSLSANTRLVIVNAIYFKGDWKYQFKKSNTKREPFYLDRTRTVGVKMMAQKKKFRYGQSKSLKAKVLELPYKGDELSMVIILPDKPHGLAQLESNLTTDILKNLRKEFRIHKWETLVKLPSFKLEASFDLEETLPEMGMKNLFDPSKSDLSGITRDNDLFVSKVVHKAYLNVDEEGSEAAAATGVIMMLTSMPQGPKRFVADHPFLFIIRDNTTGAVVFMGRMCQPQSYDESESVPPVATTTAPVVPTPVPVIPTPVPVMPTPVPVMPTPTPAIPTPAPSTVPALLMETHKPADNKYVTHLWVEPDICTCDHPATLLFPKT